MYYDFQCQACSTRFEVQKSIHDSSNANCPACGKEALRVITGGSGFLGKGMKPSDCTGSPAACPSAHKCGMGCCH
ncbi:MAG: zinc ribbon domain-containing protein [Fibrobacterota bacterium]